MTMKLTISKGNSKLGAIANLSLPPGEACRPDVACLRNGCYALKAFTMYAGTRKAWGGNLNLWRTSPQAFRKQLDIWLQKRRPDRFRFHVGGDIPDREYFLMIRSIASNFPGTKFLVFTKRYDILTPADFQRLPGNLTVILSRWPGVPAPAGGFDAVPNAWLAEDPERPQNADECSGKCDICGDCWGRSSDIVFHRH